MASINHSIGLKVDREKILEALTTTQGLSGWWTSDVRGSTAKGETLQFRFNENGLDFQVTHSSHDKVSWKCVSGPEEWLGTQVHFELSDTEIETMLFLEHTGWREESPFHHHCSMKWAVFLLSLKDYLEKGQGRPFPEDIHINHATG